MSDHFEDERGLIRDLFVGPLDAVTEIFTVKGAVRGNHVHRETTQWTYIVSGSLEMMHGTEVSFAAAGELVKDEPGMPHAWKALEDTLCLVFTKGPRSGEDYESDTYRLEEPLLA